MPVSTLTIGRRQDNDIVLTHDSVSRCHAELIVLEQGRAYLTDCGSTGGTRIFRRGTWQAIRQEFIEADERIRFGDYETTIEALLNNK